MNIVVVERFELVGEIVEFVGSVNFVVVIDVKWNGFFWEVYIYGGRKLWGIDVVEWVRKVEELGVGEIFLMSMDIDGMKEGFDILLMWVVVNVVDIFVIVFGGVGRLEYFYEVFKVGVEVVLVVLIFYYGY